MEKQKINKSQLLGIIVGIICCALAYWGVQQLFKPSLDKELNKLVVEMNKMTPIDYDEMSFDSVKTPGNKELQYYYTLVYNSDEVNMESFKTVFEPTIIEGLSNNKEMDYLRSKNVIFTYIYYSKDGKKVYEINVTPEIYNKEVKHE